ncbi:MAG TPA: flagellar basal-body MS-ring/collar protein FliF [Phenylobacterium sp.]
MSLVGYVRNASPARQLGLAAVGVLVITAILVTVYFLFLRTPYAVLYSGLRTADAATVVAELEKRKTPYRLAAGGETILVPARVADAARLEIAGADLPLKGTVGFELFNKSDMGLTEFAQQINYRRALQGELARTIMSMEGVESARVHLSLAEPTVFRQDRRPSKASVSVIPRGSAPIAPETVAGIQRLVAAAATDLEPESVVVLNERGVVLSGEIFAQTLAADDLHDPVLEQQADSIRLALRQFYHDRKIEVLVSAADGARRPADAAASSGLGRQADAPRTFPVRVTVLMDGALTNEDRAQIQQLAVVAAGLDPSLGDRLTIKGTGQTAPASQAAPVPQGSPAPSAPTWGASPIQYVLAAALLLLLAAAWMLHSRRTPAPRVLTLQQKKAYAARLQILLPEETADVLR